MAKNKTNKNRSYREMVRRQREQEALAAEKRREELESGMKVIMFAFSIVTVILVILAIFKLIGQALLFIWAITEIVYAFCCFIEYLKSSDKAINNSDKSIKKMCIVMFVCACISIIAVLIFT